MKVWSFSFFLWGSFLDLFLSISSHSCLFEHVQDCQKHTGQAHYLPSHFAIVAQPLESDLVVPSVHGDVIAFELPPGSVTKRNLHTQSRGGMRAANQVSVVHAAAARRMLGLRQMSAAALRGFHHPSFHPFLCPVIMPTMCLLRRQHRMASSPVISIMLIISGYWQTLFVFPSWK